MVLTMKITLIFITITMMITFNFRRTYDEY